jgi:hypothetical protein
MASLNGLIASTDVCATGDPQSNFFLRKGEPIAVPSPIQIISPNGAEVGSIAESNAGVMTLSTDSDVVLVPGSGIATVVADGGANKGLVVKPATEASGVASITLKNGATATTPTYYTLYNSSLAGGGLTSGNFQVFGYSGAGFGTIREVIECNPTGSSIALGDLSTVGGAVVNVNGSLGASRVYDAVYNPPPAPIIPASGISLTNLLSVGTPSATNTFALPSAGTWLVTGNLTLQSVTTNASGLIQVIASGTSVTAIPVASYSGTLQIPFTTFIVGNSMTLTASMGGLTAIGGSPAQQFIWWSYQKVA